MLCFKKRITFLFWLIITLIYQRGIAQEFPPIEVFTPQVYGADNQNWSIAQGDDEIIYIANNKGLLEYNGAKWILNSTQNQTIVRSVAVIDDKIFTGSYMEFGYWQRNNFGDLEYNSLIDNLKTNLIQDEEFWSIIALQDWILFQSFDRIYIYNSLNQEFRIIESDTQITKMYKVGNSIYFQKINDGIYKIESGKAVLISDDYRFKNNEIINIFNGHIGLLVQTREEGFYKYENNKVYAWETESKDLLSRVSAYNSIRLKNGDFIIGTISNGLIKLRKDGRILFRMNQDYGLSNNTVLSLFEDVSDNIWIGLDNGVNVLNLGSPYRVYRDKGGDLGTVYTSAKTDKYLYLGTNQGLFYKANTLSEEFKLIEGTKGQVWTLQNIEGTLFCGHDKGTFTVRDTDAFKVSNQKGTWLIKEIEDLPNLLIQGNYKGLSILQKNELGHWEFRNKIEGFDFSSRYFEFINRTELLVNHEYKGVYKIKLNNTYTKVLSYTKDTIAKGIGSSLFEYNNTLYYAFQKGVFKYHKEENSFTKDSILSSFISEDNYVSGKFINDNSGNKLWGFLKNKLVYFEPGKLTDVPTFNAINLPSNLRKSKLGYENIIQLTNNLYLLGTTEGYIVIDLNKFKSKPYSITINSISYSDLHRNKTDLSLTDGISLKHNQNSLHFTYSVPDYNKFFPTLYQYHLKGIYDEWSTWSVNSEVFFENLPYGDYIFETRAKVGDNLTTNTASYSFTITKPWYLKPLAIGVYVILIIFLAALVQYLNTKYYKNQQEKLIAAKERELEFKQIESQRQLIEFKNQNLQLDIDSKNRELGLSTMNLIRKNEFLGDLKKELSKINTVEEVNRVVKIIDKNINNTEDWKYFEEAFNSADKDFLKKIKKMHPLLTPNDLKLCAYLRLNLSSKEIAPLLNISHRSVEVKRYRLRKKIDLPHEASLTSYILEI